jgi:hypothetical protein
MCGLLWCASLLQVVTACSAGVSPSIPPPHSYCVATHPEVEEKLLRELRGIGLPCNGNLEDALAVLEAKGPDGVSAGNMPYMAAVLNEAMRMYPAGASASPRWGRGQSGVCSRLQRASSVQWFLWQQACLTPQLASHPLCCLSLSLPLGVLQAD